MTKIEKQIYNQQHYRKNKKVLLQKAKQKSKSSLPGAQNVIPLFKSVIPNETTVKPPRKRK